MQKIFDGIKAIFLHYKPQPLTETVDGEHYKVVPTEDGLQVGEHIRKPAPIAKPKLELQTLTGFADAYAANIDSFPLKVAVHVIDHNTVALRSLEADEFGRRHEWLRSINNEKNPFPFNEYQIPEQFLINLQSGFLPTDDVITLQKFASALSNDSSISTQDDGFSQTVAIRAGGVTRSEIALPKRISLYAYRTFREIDPVASEFIIRLKGKQGELPTIALIEVDAGRWKLDSIALVSKWLKNTLKNAVVIA